MLVRSSEWNVLLGCLALSLLFGGIALVMLSRASVIVL